MSATGSAWGVAFSQAFGVSFGILAEDQQFFAGSVIPGMSSEQRELDNIILDDDDVIFRVITKFIGEQ
jgi:hypothetical protein